MVTALKKWSAGTLVVFMLVAVPSVVRAERSAPDPTPTAQIAACIDHAADEFVNCTNSVSYWWRGACALVYAADAILCVPTRALPSKM